MDTQVEDFLEHFGVKGQKWGVRAKISPSGKTSYSRSPLQKTAIAGGAIAGSVAATKFAMNMGKGRTISQPFAIIAGGAGAIAGARFARTLVDKNSAVPVSELGGKHISDKKLSRGEKGYATYVGFSALAATAGMLITKSILNQ